MAKQDNAPNWQGFATVPAPIERENALKELFYATESLVDVMHSDREVREDYCLLIGMVESALRRAYPHID